VEKASRDTSDERLRDMVARVQRLNTRLVSAATTLTAGDDVVLVTTSGGSVTVTLPDAKTHLGKVFYIKKMSAANTMTIQRSGSDTIDGSTTASTTTQYQSFLVVAALVTAPATFGYAIV